MLPETTSPARQNADFAADCEGCQLDSYSLGSFHSELTPEGEQLVIPGCERNRSARMRQLDLFG